ncbi:MAG: L28 family ribosomal protein [Patescibacteria group bacterium]
MSYACALCGKGTINGKDQTHRHGGMWALRGPSHPKKWHPNLRTVRVEIAGKITKLRVCVTCLRSKIKQTVEAK